jgi:hypothetical protein
MIIYEPAESVREVLIYYGWGEDDIELLRKHGYLTRLLLSHDANYIQQLITFIKTNYES